MAASSIAFRSCSIASGKLPVSAIVNFARVEIQVVRSFATHHLQGLVKVSGVIHVFAEKQPDVWISKAIKPTNRRLDLPQEGLPIRSERGFQPFPP